MSFRFGHTPGKVGACESVVDMPQLKKLEDIPNEVAQGDYGSVKQTFTDFQAQGEDYVKQFPTKSVLYALGAGFVLRLLPIGALIGVLVRLALFALRPALFIYGGIALYRHYQESATADKA